MGLDHNLALAKQAIMFVASQIQVKQFGTGKKLPESLYRVE